MSENQPANPSADAAARPAPAQEFSRLTQDDVYLFNEGSHFRLYEKLGAHPVEADGLQGVYFAVWAPNAEAVSVMGDFNGWDKHSHPLQPRESSGIWEGIIPQLEKGALYKYHIRSRYNDYQADKADPFAFFNQIAPEKASVVWNLDYDWQDGDWMAGRGRANAFDAPIAVYEVHPGSWQRVPEDRGPGSACRRRTTVS